MIDVKVVFLCCLMLAIALTASAQAPTEEDLAGIKQAALDYAGSWYTGDAARMEKALSPDLAKRIVRTRDGKSRVENMGALALVQGVRSGYGAKTPKEQQQADVTVLDVFGNAATVKLIMSGWIDYLHIGKVDGRWVIINVLWEMKPEKAQ
jgi:hypothetical protein